MRRHLAAASAAAAAVTTLVLPATAQAAPQAAVPSTASSWVIDSGPFASLSKCQITAELYGYNSRNSYCNQLSPGRWYLIVWR